MLDVLLESHAARPRRLGSAITSALLHGATVVAAVALALPGRVTAPVSAERPDSVITFVLPTQPPPLTGRMRAGPDETPRLPELPTLVPPTVTPVNIPPVGDLGPVVDDRIRIGPEARPGSPLAPSDRQLDVGSGGVVDAGTADRVPRLLGRAIEPRYPSQLRAAGTEGSVVAEFVIDTLGRAELEGLRFPGSTHPLFAASIREALARYRFTPGELGGQKVRTRVQLPFEFRLTR
ncbi:MAG: energy transducer TonB [Gemmatimonadales bacterium]